MKFYVRKAINVGPFRFNLLKSGIDVSAGVKGLRFGTGPRGNDVHIGRGGLYYRKTLPSVSAGNSQAPNSPELQHGNNTETEQEAKNVRRVKAKLEDRSVPRDAKVVDRI